MKLENVCVVSSVRTPIGKAQKGVFKTIRPDDLGAFAVKEALKRSNISSKEIEDVIIGCAMPEAEQGMNVARIISLRANIPKEASACTVNRFCSSGLHALFDVAKSIELNQIRVGIAGGVESMSMVPMGGNKFSANPYLAKNMPDAYLSMGLTAEEVSQEFGISRQMQDEFSLKSHQKAIEAIKNGFFKEEIVEIEVDGKLINKDEGPREDTTIETLLKLKPVFKLGGTVTAGNSSQISDGAAASVLVHKSMAQKEQVLGYPRCFVTAGVDPRIMGVGPVPAIKKLLKVTGLSLKDIDVFEINEAFAAQAVYSIKELGINIEKVNPYGGAIALGHPLGCTGARQTSTILHYMKRHSLRYGIVSMCIGGGMGAAALFERT